VLSLTAKKTAKAADKGARIRTFMDYRRFRLNCCGRWRTSVDRSPAVFKTVCGL